MLITTAVLCSPPRVRAENEEAAEPAPETAVDASPSAAHIDKQSKKFAEKYEVSRIGQRDIGKGLNFYSLEAERALGQKIADRIEQRTHFIHDRAVIDYVTQLGQRLVRHSDAQVPFTIRIIDSRDLNIFSLPGGFLYLDSGLIQAVDSEAELASLMAHEIAHVAARHATRQRTRMNVWKGLTMLAYVGGPAGFAVGELAGLGVPLEFKKMSRDAETEADLLGLEYEYDAGYDPEAFVDYMEKLQVREQQMPKLFRKAYTSPFMRAFSPYPMTSDRIKHAQEAITALLPAKKEYIVDSNDFEDAKSRINHLSDDRGTSVDGKPVLRRHLSGASIPGKDGKSKSDGSDNGPVLHRPWTSWKDAASGILIK
ncbi:MAG TPA: M48 family metalloprotease [Terriglobales bacterium]|nr:M48 family metalloprotease [Terriglobales bacterium]